MSKTTTATLQLGGLPVSRKKFRVGWIAAQIKELQTELRTELPKQQGAMTDIEWRSIQECKALVEQQIVLLEDWLTQEKRGTTPPAQPMSMQAFADRANREAGNE